MARVMVAPPANPDPDLTRTLARCLPGGRLAGPLYAFGTVVSTQIVARDLAAAGAPEGTVVVADYQGEGRGRYGRSWLAPPGTALLFSCVLRPPWPLARWVELPLLAGCAVAEGVEGVTGVGVRLKWPNDILAGGRKLAGVLAEGGPGPHPHLVLGIGLNVRQGNSDWPPNLAGRAVSLAGLGVEVERDVLLAAVLARLAARYDDLLRHGFTPVRAAWTARAASGVRVRTPAGEGIALGLDVDGALRVRRDDGTLIRLHAAADLS